MRNFKGIIGAAVIAALGVVGNGCSDNDNPAVVTSNTVFGTIDVNGDGFVSPAEWDASFVVWDVNGDGFISPAEYPLNAGFAALDVDANLLISRAEWDGAFALWDVNGDGFLVPSELFF